MPIPSPNGFRDRAFMVKLLFARIAAQTCGKPRKVILTPLQQNDNELLLNSNFMVIASKKTWQVSKNLPGLK